MTVLARLAGGSLVAAGMLLASVPVRADVSCARLQAQGGQVADTYVMDFGARDKLYVYIVRMPDGSTQKCTSQRPLRSR